MQALKKFGLRHRSTVIWEKYYGQKLTFRKKSRLKTCTPNNVDFLEILTKSVPSYKYMPDHVDMRLLCKEESAIVRHQADQETQFKPLSLCSDIVAALSPDGGTVLETYMGSANLGEASLKQGRKYIGIETNRGLFNAAVAKLNKINNKINKP